MIPQTIVQYRITVKSGQVAWTRSSHFLFSICDFGFEMTLVAGTKLGPYEIVALIGAGGMGEVYRARDTKLNRDVALKVLPAAFANDAQRMARFQREAQVLASLNHPNIASIYGLEESGGVRALVMELVEGPTLAERVAQGPIPLDEALPIAKQIAEALEAAHEKGIIHRDLKPANVKITPEGVVKVLDFGLAKALEGDGAGGQVSGAGLSRVTHADRDGDAGRCHFGHGSLYESRAGARQARRSPCRHLGVRCRALRDADRQAGVRGRDHFRHAGRRD